MRRFVCFVLLQVLAVPILSFSQQAENPCAPPAFKIDKEKNMFSAQQEAWLGDILDDEVVKSYNKLEDPDGYLKALGERLLAQLPPTDRKYSFYIVDYPENNAFSVGGSKIYVARQLVAFLKNEDELAGLLGHEIGHIYTHQRAIDLTRIFRQKFGIKEVGDRNDIFDKWNMFEDSWRKKHLSFDLDREEYEQQIADRIGLYTMMRAGYQPARLAEFFDRLTENQNKKGNFFTDMFGVTTPEAKRFRLIINKATPLPQGCVAVPQPQLSHEQFLAWQTKVIAANRVRPQEQVSGIVKKMVLDPPLRGSLNYLQFSPDGKYLLAQDESTVFVLSREPLANLFSFDAENAQSIQVETGVASPQSNGLMDQTVQFTPDSRSVVFYDMEMRVQKWDIATKQRTSIQEVTVAGQCFRTSLSSTGDVLACLKNDRSKDDFLLELIDVPSNTVFFSKKVNPPQGPDIYDLANSPLRFFPRYVFMYFSLGFSPDAHYFILGSNSSTVAYDLQTHQEIGTNGAIRKFTSAKFTFLTSNRLVGVDPEHSDKAAFVTFPAGVVQENFDLKVNQQQLINVYGSEGKLIPAARGPYLLITPASRWPMAVINLETRSFLLGYKSAGLAIYDTFLAGEELGGRISLFNLSDHQRLATVQLPSSLLPNLASAEFSGDGKWLATAGRTSGGVWNVATGARAVDTGTFTGGFFDGDDLVAIFHQLEQQPKVGKLDPVNKKTEDLYTIEVPDPKKKNGSVHHYIWQSGNLFLEQLNKDERQTCPLTVGGCRVKEFCFSCKLPVQARDIRTNQPIWIRRFAEFIPVFFYSKAGDTLTLLFESHYAVKAEVKANPELKPLMAAAPDNESVNLIEVIKPETGELVGSLIINTGSTSIVPLSAISAANTVLMYDRANRTHVYSLDSGKERGRVLGRFRALSQNGDKMLVENERGECDLYDTSTLLPLSHFTFPTRLIRAEFITDGNLLVLTADQTIYRVQPTAVAQDSMAH
ncbi:MAG TPA: M48 family metalloprotease [Candidatus Angelobacter sp.]|nr:M48 family metalloprotease [Candidatus Angelobacter sp.]